MLFTEMLVIPVENFPDSLMRPPEKNIWPRNLHQPHRRAKTIHLEVQRAKYLPSFLNPHLMDFC